MKKVKILNVQFDSCTKDEALKRIIDYACERGDEGAKQIVTPNPEMLLESEKNQLFRETLNRAWISIPDGIGILWASTFQLITQKTKSPVIKYFKAFFSLLSLLFYPKFCTKLFPERITGVDMMETLCGISQQRKMRIFLLGAKIGIAETAKCILENKYPGIQIVGTFSGTPFQDDFARIQSLLAETQAEILFVAYGSPNQEIWIFKHLHELKPVKIAMGVGGAFDFIAGIHKRAPVWMRKTGLEWLYRVIQEPSRIKRIWNATVKFPLRIINS